MLPVLEKTTPVLLQNIESEMSRRDIDVRRWKMPFWGEGICAPFRDGFDAWFFPALSSAHTNLRIEIGNLDDASAARVLSDEWQRIDEARRRILVALRHWAAEQNYALAERSNGHWNWQSGIVESCCDVSFSLTRVVQNQPDLTRAFCAFLRAAFGVDVTIDQAEKFLSTEGAAEKVAWKNESASSLALPLLAFDEKAFDKAVSSEMPPAETANATFAARLQLGFLATQKLIERIGGARFSLDMKCRAQFEYSDGGDGFTFLPRRRAWRENSDDIKAEALADQIEQRYRKIDASRARFHNGWLAWANARQLGVEKSARGTWHAGEKHIEYSIERGRILSLKLQNQTPENLLAQWIQQKTGVTLSVEEARDWCDQNDVPIREIRLLSPAASRERLMNWEEIDIQTVDETAENLLTDKRQRIARGEDPSQLRGHYAFD